MSEVARYEEGDPCAGMYESSEGVWVHIDDYDQLKENAADTIDDLHAEIRQLKADVSKQENNNMTLILRMQKLEAENERILNMDIAATKLLNLALEEKDALRKQLEEAREVIKELRYACTDIQQVT